MNLRYPGDFTQTRPWGRLGDDKCDGYLPSQRKSYQCYAPDELRQPDTIRKLNEDFPPVFPFYTIHFNTWVFVHNCRDSRIPSWLTFELDRLRQLPPNIPIETLGFMELRQTALSLDDIDLIGLFGPFPSLNDILALQYEDIYPLLFNISRNSEPVDTEPVTVSAQKLDYNKLSQDAALCLRNGMTKSTLVRSYLDNIRDKELASRVTNAFHEKYLELRQDQSDPDQIFFGLRVFAQGPFAQTPKVEGAVMAILAYLFEECDIFENPPNN